MTEALANKKRIWEIDACRGLAILCVLLVHVLCFLDDFSSIEISWTPAAYYIKQYGGSYFVFLAGVSAHFSHKSVKRGLIVLALGFVLTAATAWLYKSGAEDEGILIQWGVLHLIGFAMIVYPLLNQLNTKALAIAAPIIIVLGYYLRAYVLVSSEYLFILGLRNPWFRAWDYFPILPHLGWFMLGIVVARVMYKETESLWPEFNTSNIVCRFLMFCGRKSLQIYIISMPLFYLIAKRL